jgi:hypothetical protein
MKKILLLSILSLAFISNVFAKDNSLISQFNYESTWRAEHYEIGSPTHTYIEYVSVGNKRMVLGDDGTGALGKKSIFEFDNVSGDVLLKRTNQSTIIIGKINGNIDDISGTITLAPNFKAQMKVINRKIEIECTVMLIDTCLFHGPKIITALSFKIFENGKEIYVSRHDNQNEYKN